MSNYNLAKFQAANGMTFTMVVDREHDSPFDMADRMNAEFLGWCK